VSDLRFGTLNALGLRSAIWRLWIWGRRRADIYLSVRSFAGALKISLHQSERCQVSFTSEFVAFLEERGLRLPAGRHIDTWPSPEIAPGVRLPVRIVVPASELRAMKALPANKPVLWVPAPPQDRVTELVVLTTESNVHTSDWPGSRAMRTQLLFSTQLIDGRVLWLVYRHTERNDDIDRLISDTLAKASLVRPVTKFGSPDPDSSGLRFIAWKSEPDGSRSFWDLAASDSVIKAVTQTTA
jgi:hypothetical protein